MESSIMKLLENDEDETMHSGADLEAFAAALNRDIARASSPPPPPETISLPQGSGSGSDQLIVQRQPTQEGTNGKDKLQEEKQNLPADPEVHSSQIEVMQHGSVGENKDRSQQEYDQLQMQEHLVCSDQRQKQTETHSVQSAEMNQPCISEQNSMHHVKEELLHSESQIQHNARETNNQQAPIFNQANSAVKKFKPGGSAIPFQMLMPILRPHLDKDRLMQLQSFYAKLRNNEVSKEDFLRAIRNIIGEQMFRQTVQKVQIQLHAQEAWNQKANANQHSLQNQAVSQHNSTCATQTFTDPQAFSSLNTRPVSQNEKGLQSLANQPYLPISSDQTSEANFRTLGASHISREAENKLDGKGSHTAQLASNNSSTINIERESPISSFQAISKQQHSTNIPPTSFSMYGNTVNTIHSHTFPRPSSSGASGAFRPQAHEPQIRPSFNQGPVLTQSGVSQPMNVMAMPKYEQKNSVGESKRVLGGTLPHLPNHSFQQNPMAWQSSANKEQRNNTITSMVHVKKEAADHTAESHNKSQLTAHDGPSCSSAHIDQDNLISKSTRDENTEKLLSRMAFSNSTSMMTPSQLSGSSVLQVEPTTQTSHVALSPPVGATTKPPPKKTLSGQKKSLEALGASSPPASKKQKTSGALLDQSIEQLNDVTAVSGVNLREEEEQLFSAPKEDTRAFEASRWVVLEEEEKLILQKAPLKRRLGDIMSKSGIESMSSDVERCLSLCVEERLRGLVSNMIRLSKQRIDLEKTRHQFVVTSDVRQQILTKNQKAKEEWEQKHEQVDRLQKLNQAEGTTGAEADKEKDETRAKPAKANKEEDDKMRTATTNVAARAATGGDDVISKWQLMAEQARQKRDGATSPQRSKVTNRKNFPTLGRSLKSGPEPKKKDFSAASAAAGGIRNVGKATVVQPKITRSITMKDVISVLHRDPQMSRSTMMYRIYDRIE